MIRKIINYLKEDYNRRTFIFALASTLINLAFAAYNGIVGLTYGSIWHTSIFFYYILLMCVKLLLVLGNRKKNEKSKIFILYFSFAILLLITIAMIAPTVLLVQGKRKFDWGLIPAITAAAYTTYAMATSIINFLKVKTNDNAMVKQIRLIKLITALMSIFVLQNTMILANGGYDDKMRLLSIYTSIGIITSIVIIEIYSFVIVVKNHKKEKKWNDN